MSPRSLRFCGFCPSLIAAIKSDKTADEWERSCSRFSYHWGGTIGGSIVALLLALPPFHALIVRVAAWAHGPDVSEIDRTAVLLVFIAGFGTLVLAQTLCTVTFFYLWRRRTLGHVE